MSGDVFGDGYRMMFLSNDRFRDLLSSPPQPWLPGIFADIMPWKINHSMQVNIPLPVTMQSHKILWDSTLQTRPENLVPKGDFRLPF